MNLCCCEMFLTHSRVDRLHVQRVASMNLKRGTACAPLARVRGEDLNRRCREWLLGQPFLTAIYCNQDGYVGIVSLQGT
jgi:hypothetical protein